MSASVPSSPVLYGRDGELAVVDELLEAARASRSGCLVIRGEAGMGKSALLAAASERAGDLQVVRAIGVESESELAFAALHQLTAPLLGRLDDIPGPQALALAGALGIAPSSGHDRFLVGAGLLSLLAAAAEERPLLCLVDDAHWLDDPSADALTFAARRFHSEGIVLLFAAREGDVRSFEAAGVPELVVTGLDPAAAGTLLAEHAGANLSADVRDRLVESTAGNPLALLELPRALTEEQLAGTEPLVEPLPLTARVENAFLARVRSLPEASQKLLLVAALDDTGDPDVVFPGAAALGVDAAALEPAEAAGLVTVADGMVRFRHPLVRSAVHQAASFAQRQGVHEALVGALAGDRYADRRAWHRAAATLGSDAEVADELAESADRARQRGGFGAAAAALERAAVLTPDDQKKAERLAAAAQAAWLGGQASRAAGLASSARSLNTDPLVQADIDYLRGTMELQRGRAIDAHTILFEAATAVAPIDPRRAVEMFVSSSEAAGFAGKSRTEARSARRMVEQLQSEEARRFEIIMMRGLVTIMDGDAAAARRDLLRAIELAEASDNPRREIWQGAAAVYLGRMDDARDYYARAAESARAQSAIPTLAWALAMLAAVEVYGGVMNSAAANAEEGLRLARDTGQLNCAAYELGCLAAVAGFGGREEECRARAAEALDIATANGLGIQAAMATWALAELELSLGRGVEAYTHWDAFYGGDPEGPNQAIRNVSGPSYIEACVRSGHHDAARAEIEHVENWARGAEASAYLPLVARSHALIAREADAAARFDEALALHAADDHPFDRARTELAYGEFLRRGRARRAARDHLRTALQVFEQLGAVLWAERARAELRASGETARKRDPSTMDTLTPQELQIARFVSSGATNKEVAAQLFLSPRTIDFHLRNVFSKLGISSRRELSRFRLEDGALAVAGEGPVTSPARA